MQMPVDRWRDCACGAARNAAVSADPWQHLSRPLSGRAQSVGPTAQVCLGFLAAEWLNCERERKQRWGERRSPRVGCSAAQPSSTSARLHWLSMEREQGDGDTSPGGPSVMDYTAENRYTGSDCRFWPSCASVAVRGCSEFWTFICLFI